MQVIKVSTVFAGKALADILGPQIASGYNKLREGAKLASEIFGASREELGVSLEGCEVDWPDDGHSRDELLESSL